MQAFKQIYETLQEYHDKKDADGDDDE